MGHKVNPLSFRLEIKNSPHKWQSRWYASKGKYHHLLLEDLKIRKFLDERLASAGLAQVRIERLNKKLKIVLVTTRPGLVIGRGGKGLEDLKKDLVKILSTKNSNKNLDIQVEELKNPDSSAKLIGEKIAYQLGRRMPYRRVVSNAMEKAISSGALGIKIILSGRINGAEISRTEKFSSGPIPLSTLRSHIDYYEKPAATRSGYIGVKIFLNKGENI
jgi:small subunit ribosomal protein S3